MSANPIFPIISYVTEDERRVDITYFGQQFNNNIMFHDERIPNIGIRVLHSGKEEYMEIDIEINQAGEINLNQLVAIIKEAYQLDPHTLFFYLDHSHGAFEHINQEQLINTHFTSLISENLIVFKCEPRLSDQILANPPKFQEETRAKRSRERVIEEAFLQVEQWRYFYREGCLNEQGVRMKINLQQSAQIVGVPRKTLEDYFLLLRMGRSLEFDFKTNRKQRIGVLRLYVRQRTKIKNIPSKEIDQKKFFKELRFQLLGMKNEEEIFDILKSNRSHSSSDEDMIFQH